MSTDLLALLDRDPAAGILAVADMREQRATAATEGVWQRWHDQEGVPGWDGFIVIGDDADEGEECNPVARVYVDTDAEFILGEQPRVALAAVRRWRGVVERHWRDDEHGTCDRCVGMPWPCADLNDTAAEASAYLGGAR